MAIKAIGAEPDGLLSNMDRLALLPSGIDFYRVDWKEVFRLLEVPHENPFPPFFMQYMREDGTFDFEGFRSEFGDRAAGNVRRYVGETPAAPNIDLLVEELSTKGGEIDYLKILAAIPNPDSLPATDRERMAEAIAKHCEILIDNDEIRVLFMCFESLFLIWFDEFRLLNDRLPLALRTENVRRMPSMGSPDYVRHVIIQNFPDQPELHEELVAQALRYHRSIEFLQGIYRFNERGGLPLKATPVGDLRKAIGLRAKLQSLESIE